MAKAVAWGMVMAITFGMGMVLMVITHTHTHTYMMHTIQNELTDAVTNHYCITIAITIIRVSFNSFACD